MTNNKQQTPVEWLEQEMLKPNLSMKEILEQAKEMEEKQKGYTLEQMMDCWNAALKFEPHGPNFNDYIMSLKLKENRDKQLDFLTEQAQELNLGYNKTTEE
jgi:hypothetical protein